MERSPRNSGSIAVLIALLLVVCYLADWTEDFSSYWNAVRYSSFESANGLKAPISGGSTDTSTLLASFAFRARKGSGEGSSALEAVYGAPISSADATVNDGSSPRGTGQPSTAPQSSLGAFQRDSSFGISGANSGRLSGATNGFGMRGATSPLFGPQ